ncbi:hypothetical protein HGM15179_014029, partial [Zosterops borbonicus]
PSILAMVVAIYHSTQLDSTQATSSGTSPDSPKCFKDDHKGLSCGIHNLFQHLWMHPVRTHGLVDV